MSRHARRRKIRPHNGNRKNWDKIVCVPQGKRKRRAAWFHYLSYHHLQKNLRIYGKEMSRMQILGWMLLGAGMMGILGALFQLQWIFSGIPMLFGMLMVPAWIDHYAKRKYEAERFAEVTMYLEQVLYAFQREKKILTALQDVQSLFATESRMYQILQHVLEEINGDYQSESPLRKGLQILEQEYDCSRVRVVHRFMEKVEQLGGNFDDSVELLLSDCNLWEKRVMEQKKETETVRRNIAISVLLSLGVCVSTLYIMPLDIRITETALTQVTAVVLLLLDLYLLYRADCSLSPCWLTQGVAQNAAYMEERYLRVISYQEKAERKKSFLLSIFPAIGFAIAFFQGKKAGAILWGILLLFCAQQHKIGHALNKRLVKRAIEQVFPEWLMEMALLLQADNVQVSLKKTYEGAAAVLRPALRKLYDALEENPESADPYLEFLQEQDLPGIHSAMKMLYAISMGKGGDAAQQIREILQRNTLLVDKAERIAQEDASAGGCVYFLLPVLSGAMKLILDLSVFLISFMQNGGDIWNR